MIYKITNKLKKIALNTPMVNMAMFGDIMDYDDKADIKYPYVNIDVVSANVVNYAQTYTFRIYVCDRNIPYTAYNKAETIINTFLKNNEINAERYTINYFTLNFKDQINGVWADITIQAPLEFDCEELTSLD